jgi:hypothetical protein
LFAILSPDRAVALGPRGFDSWGTKCRPCVKHGTQRRIANSRYFAPICRMDRETAACCALGCIMVWNDALAGAVAVKSITIRPISG